MPCFLFFVIILLLVGQNAAAEGGPKDAFAGASLAFDTPAPEPRTDNPGSWGVGEQTGAATYTYEIPVPPGRSGMQPDLALRYSSNGPLRGGIAAGWTLNLPRIELDPTRGDPDRVGEAAYRATFGGRTAPLVRVDDRLPAFEVLGGRVWTYRMETDDSFVRFVRFQDPQGGFSWWAMTPDGVRHFFEEDESERTFGYTRWHITEREDRNGNRVRYVWEPVRDELAFRGEIVDMALDRIEYTANPGAGLRPHAKVEFTWSPNWDTCFESHIPMGAAHRNGLGADQPGYLEGALRLQTIDIHVRDTPERDWRHTRRIRLRYSTSSFVFDGGDGGGPGLPDHLDGCALIAAGERADLRHRYLTSIRHLGFRANGASEHFPSLEFEYAVTEGLPKMSGRRSIDRGFDSSGTTSGAQRSLHDVNGDGVLDRVEATLSGETCELRYQATVLGGALGPERPLVSSSADWCSVNGFTDGEVLEERNRWEWEQVRLHFLDLTADGLTDLLVSRQEGWSPLLGQGDGFQAPPELTLLSGRFGFVGGLDLGGQDVVLPPDSNDDFPLTLPPPTSAGDIARQSRPQPAIGLFGDLDANGKADVIDLGTHPRLLGDGEWQVALRRDGAADGVVFDHPEAWPVPRVELASAPGENAQGVFVDGASTRHQTRTVVAGLHDVNGDGLPDLLAQTEDRRLRAFMNYGRGFRTTPVETGLDAPLEVLRTDFEGGPGTERLRDGARGYIRRLVDVDHDGLVDMLVLPSHPIDIREMAALPRVHLNLGDRFTKAIELDADWARAKRLVVAEDGDWAVHTDYVDVDADRRPDLVRWSRHGSLHAVRTAAPAPAHALLRVRRGRTEALVVTYRYAPATDRTIVEQTGRPGPGWVLEESQVTGGHGTPPMVRTYRYGGATYLPSSGLESDERAHRFLGYAEVTVTAGVHPVADGHEGL